MPCVSGEGVFRNRVDFFLSSRHRIFTRTQAILQARRKLETESYPWLQTALIAALTGAFGLLSSFEMLRQGLDSMAMRYPLAVVLSYAVYRYVRGGDPGHLLASAVRGTFVPFVATAIFLGLAGAGLSAYAPGSRSVGEVVRGGSSSP